MISGNQPQSIRRLIARGRRLYGRHPSTPEAEWFWDHYDRAAGEIASFCEEGEVSLRQAQIADVGCGDGILSLGLFHRVRPRKLVGFDIVPTNVQILLDRCRQQGAAEVLPKELEFRESAPTRLPAADGEFDFVYSWSAFEHIADPPAVLGEIRRILRPTGHFFLQLWPFYRSQKGSHLWHWYDDDFHHLLTNEDDVAASVLASDRHAREWTEYMVHEFQQLNRVTVDQLQAALLEAGFDVRRLELLANPINLQPELAKYSWTDLAISGVKLLALPLS